MKRGGRKMKKKIIFGSIFAAILMLSIPMISATQTQISDK